MNSGGNRITLFMLAALILGLSICFPTQHLPAAQKQSAEDVFSIQAVNEPLRDVFKKISKASGYEIRFNIHLADERVSIKLENVTLDEAIDRVLKAYNHFSLWDDSKKIITLLVFKDNLPPVGMSGINRIFELATDTTAGP